MRESVRPTCAAVRPRRADSGGLSGIQHEDGPLGQRARHPHLLLHRPEGLGVDANERVKAIRRYVDRLFIIFPFDAHLFPETRHHARFRGQPARRRHRGPADRRSRRPEEFRRPQLPRPTPDRRPAGRQPPERDPRQPAANGRAVAKIPRAPVRGGGASHGSTGRFTNNTQPEATIRYVCDQTYETLCGGRGGRGERRALATLETALLGIPEVVVYRTVWWQVWLRPYVLKVPLGVAREPEPGARGRRRDHPVGFLRSDRAERELRAILHGGSKRGKMLADFGRTENDHRRPGSQRTVCGTDGRRTTRTENKIASDERPARSSARRSICNRMQPAGKRFPMLISGYNTLPKEKRKNKSYIDGSVRRSCDDTW